MKSLRTLALTAAFGAAFAGATASAQDVGNNSGIWWNPAPGQANGFVMLNPLTTVYGRIGFLRSFNEAPSFSGPGIPAGIGLTIPDTWGGVLGLGVRLMPVVRYELQLGGMFSAQAAATFGGVPLPGVGARFSSVQLMNNLYLDIAPFFGNTLWGLNPYGFAGIGVSWNSTGDVHTPGTIPGSGTTRTQFAWNAGAGVQWQAARNLILDVNYRYLDAGRYSLAPVGGFPGGTTSRGTAHQVMFSLVVPLDGLIRGY